MCWVCARNVLDMCSACIILGVWQSSQNKCSSRRSCSKYAWTISRDKFVQCWKADRLTLGIDCLDCTLAEIQGSIKTDRWPLCSNNSCTAVTLRSLQSLIQTITNPRHNSFTSRRFLSSSKTCSGILVEASCVKECTHSHDTHLVIVFVTLFPFTASFLSYIFTIGFT